MIFEKLDGAFQQDALFSYLHKYPGLTMGDGATTHAKEITGGWLVDLALRNVCKPAHPVRSALNMGLF